MLYNVHLLCKFSDVQKFVFSLLFSRVELIINTLLQMDHVTLIGT